jgi:uncharacterized protein YprB with RNaseH-like and TPR domain
MNPQLNLFKILFLDIETVSQKAHFDQLDEQWQYLWSDKTRFQRAEDVSPAAFYEQRAGILAEFGKIICISCGFFVQKGNALEFRVRSFYGDDEKVLLQEFAELINHNFYRDFLLCAHNGKEFDFPYIARRMVVQGIALPRMLNTAGAKPWEIQHLDTMEMWKFGDYKHYTSIKLLAAIFNIPTPKDDIDGSMVGSVYWEEKDLERIVTYCQKDTITVARVFLKMKNLDPLPEENIVYS